MTFFIIYINYFFSDGLLKKDFERIGLKNFKDYKKQLYLDLAQ